ncbi:phage tail tape measure protein [Gulbenkiania mobilis]|uniref:phage tail tape measure protein n=1 Tax=Gulbenkiania mobilis TaxID=397457 RepID=UPI0006BBE8F0|nr:phage tail tape measure protein [Gulbenkiania mobilis]
MSSIRNLKLEVILSAIDKATRPIKAVMGSSSGLSKQLKETKDRLKDLNKAQESITAFRTLTKDAKETGEKLAAARQKLKEMNEQMAAAGPPTEAMTRKLKSAEIAVEKLTLANRKKIEAAKAAKTALEANGVSVAKLGAHERELATKIDAATAAMQRQQTKLAKLAEMQNRQRMARSKYELSLENRDRLAGAGATTTAAGTAIGLPIVKMIRDYSSYEDAMLGVARQVDGARDANGKLTPTYYQMGDAIKAMAEKIPMATTEIAALVEGGARMGIKGKENLLAFARTAALASTAFDLPADQISEDLGKIANTYKIPIKNIQQLGDVINWLDDNAQSKGADIIDVMQRIAGSTGSMSYKEAAALGSTFLSLGASSEVAATATKAMVRELAIAEKQPPRFQKGLKELGLSAKQVQADMAKDSTGTIMKVMEAVKKLPEAKRMGVMVDLFGKEYGDDAAKLADNLGEYRRQLELVNATKAKGSMQREGGAKNDTLSAEWQMSQNKLFNQSSALGGSLRQPLMEAMGMIGGVLERVTAWTKANPELTATLVKIAAVLSVVMVAAGSLMLTIAGLAGPFLAARFAMSMLGIQFSSGIGIMGKLGGAMMNVGRVFLTNPIGLVVAAIAAAAYLIWSNWDTLGPKFQALWDAIKGGVQAAWDWVKEKVMAVANAIGDFLMNWTIVGFIADHWQDLKAISIAIWELIKNKVFAIGQGILDFFMNWTIVGVIVRHWDDIKAAAGTTWDWIKDKASAVGQGIVDFFMNWTLLGVVVRHWDDITNFMSGLVNKFMTIGTQIMDGLIGGFLGGLNSLKNAVNGVGESAIGWFKEKLGIHSPSRVFAALGGFTMEGLHQGIENGQGGPLGAVMNVAKRLTAAGAGIAIGAASGLAGAVTMDTRPPISAARPAATASAASPINITINAAPGMNEQQLAQLVAREVERIQRQAAARSRSRLTDKD